MDTGKPPNLTVSFQEIPRQSVSFHLAGNWDTPAGMESYLGSLLGVNSQRQTAPSSKERLHN